MALLKLVRVFKGADKGTVAATAIDERMGTRKRMLSSGTILLATLCGAVIIPVVARNRIELTLEKSWDKHRIPLSAGKIHLGKPFKLSNPAEMDWKDWLKSEAKRLHSQLSELDEKAGRSLKTLQIKIQFG